MHSVSFIAEPDFPMFHNIESRYVDQPIFDEQHFFRDIIAEVVKHAGPDVRVNYRVGCNEFECYRPEETERLSKEVDERLAAIEAADAKSIADEDALPE